ncbi:MAG TPA: aspartate kinase [Bacteroidia bacterium]|nr:aspartate kinase [Bacteroidia bacterium]HRS58517.1 aspartate kinase [Bacteroidia bacterium]HRU68548.1 aspartate kinase [Bacteroidia bacterium]
MKIFKFGGGILKEPSSLKTLARVLSEFKHDELFIVVSAFDKTTNRLENLISDYYHNRQTFNDSFNSIKSFHFSFINQLDFHNFHPVINSLWQHFNDLKNKFEEYAGYPYEVLYDQVVSFGEVFSSSIIHHYLLDKGFDSYFLDARKTVSTDQHHRNACIDEDKTRKLILEEMNNGFHQITVTQGFIGFQQNGLTTTLGREGSDYTAAVLGAVMKADKVIIWKDVHGVFNADPKYYPWAVQIKEMNYDNAAELTGLGAKVLHHRTVQPVKKSRIPLEVRMFQEKSCCGTLITSQAEKFPDIPVIIHRKNKILFILTSLNGISPGQSTLEKIDLLCKKFNLEVNYKSIFQKSMFICLSQPVEPAMSLKEILEHEYKVEIVFGVMMVKVKNGNSEVFERIKNERKIIHEGISEGINYIFY